MPIIRSAKKKLRQDEKRKNRNLLYLKGYKRLIVKLKLVKGAEKITQMVRKIHSRIDKAVKKKIIHKNKAARLKASAAKFIKQTKKIKAKK
ncbi:30S ribosomal protein S20 [Candidatus Roizmanbacteria bacterium CG_4_10_14_0_8_um_filter_36_36]|uniref:Small ribosomal subunit protein bS20 n=1 Tax=Candidatus Roizmanbacteria bacterium CG_4_8_14_3_um_filter_36_10 TaxID=1974834 RepID=A0A2M8GLC0_9BACT|nr:MAG: 30S ribosomal protein S20 [Candidatus Roizmanbacteria bacterium CG_4_10_14_0_8_um_filter_36_36]PJA53419.1 MAG: 30S ribosomal protein S20 [Candidatus Roizmanbacteria bacterium CG_4_9_14_3_um_filter_36_11]PJC81344.1 MAG: 30S ribosomal protein S20 [Candidatus Roizmanbacteria bacterium CG_4_8_14_3_um_filter_36_10]